VLLFLGAFSSKERQVVMNDLGIFCFCLVVLGH
jgi:hypothetical protein